MPYIGRDTDKISNVEVLDNITFDGSSSYTLQKGGSNFTPSSANTLLLSIDGVVQAGNFTVSGSTIDFGTAVAGTSTCDFVLHYGVGLITAPSDGTVTTAKLGDSAVTTAKINDGAITSAKINSSVGLGITEADQWRLTANITSDAFITSNLERVDDASYGKIGIGMTESSGVFTFPSTGIYLVQSQGTFFCKSGGDNVKLWTYVTINNSSYDLTAQIFGGASNQENTGFATCLVDVTDTSNVKVKFSAESISTDSYLEGDTDSNKSSFAFIRLGDT